MNSLVFLRSLLLLLSFIAYLPSYSCTYDIPYQSPLKVYDESSHVFQFIVLNKRVEYFKDSLGKKTMFPKRSIFSIHILKSYKGETRIIPKKIEYSRLGSSCGYKPNVGAVYTLATTFTKEQSSFSLWQGSNLSRTGSEVNKMYELLNKKEEGIVKFSFPTNGNRTPIMKGALKNGKRHGRWKLYGKSFTCGRDGKRMEPELLLILIYKNGRLKNVKNKRNKMKDCYSKIVEDIYQEVIVFYQKRFTDN